MILLILKSDIFPNHKHKNLIILKNNKNGTEH